MTLIAGEMGSGKSRRKLLRSEDVENGEKYYGMCEKCCDAGRGNIGTLLIFYKELHRDAHI